MFVDAVFLIRGCISHMNAEFGDHNNEINSLGTNVIPQRDCGVGCGLLHDRVAGPLFFVERTIKVNSNLYQLEQFPPHVYSIERENADDVF